MIIDSIEFKSDPIGKNCVAFYKIAKLEKLSLPHTSVQIYMGGLVERVNDPTNEELFQRYVVHNQDELLDIAKKYSSDPQPNAVPYLVSWLSGDFHLNFQAQIPFNNDTEFPQTCYNLAKYYAKRMGREAESNVLEVLVNELPNSFKLLSKYYEVLRNNPEFVITDEDFQEFKEVLKKEYNESKILREYRGIVIKTNTNKLLM